MFLLLFVNINISPPLLSIASYWYPKTWWLKTTNSYYFSFYGSGIWVQPSWVIMAQGFPQVALKISAGATVIWRFDWGGYTSKFTHVTIAGVRSLRLMARDISSLLCGPLHRAGHKVAVSFPQSQWKNERGCPRQKLWSFGHLILEVTAHHFWFILLLEVSL